MIRILSASAVLLLTLAAGTAQAEVYKWIDENGKVHYSQTKPVQSRKTEEISRTMRSGDSSTKSYAKKAEKKRPIRDIIAEEMTTTNQSLAELNKSYQENYNNLSDSRRAMMREKDKEKKQELGQQVAELEKKQKALEMQRIHKLRRLEALGRLKKKTGKDEKTDRLARQELEHLLSR